MKERLLGELNEAQEYFDRSTRALTEADSGYAPVGGTFTAAQHVAHAAQTIDWFVEGAFGPTGFSLEFEALERQVRKVTSLDAARVWFERAVEKARPSDSNRRRTKTGAIRCRTARSWAAGRARDLRGDRRPHRRIIGGALTVYARLRGKTPPMPYME